MLEPFLKWPGGKRWLVSHAEIFPCDYRRYHEPFLGSGAVYFRLAPSRAILADANVELVNAYEQIRDNNSSVERLLSRLQRRHSVPLYYHVRSMRPKTPLNRAVRFIYLNRTCFNGMYRVNRAGQFNVPIGTKRLVEYSVGHLRQIATRLRTARLAVADFESTIDGAKSGDFLYVDPPYTVMHNTNNFIKYNASLFSWSDQVRLASTLERAARRGVSVMLSNADHGSVRELYHGFGYHYRIERLSVLAASSRHRRQTSELLVTTYQIAPADLPPVMSHLPAGQRARSKSRID
jgi:DNA adenine methylase